MQKNRILQSKEQIYQISVKIINLKQKVTRAMTNKVYTHTHPANIITETVEMQAKKEKYIYSI